MNVLKQLTLNGPFACPYYPKDKQASYEEFFAQDLSPEELDDLLSNGWRKFGLYIFRPQCGQCQQCLPLRVQTQNYQLSKRERRVWNKNSDIEVKVSELKFYAEIYDLYVHFQRHRFNKTDVELNEFYYSFYLAPQNALQIEYFWTVPPELKENYHGKDKILVGVSFIDVSLNAINSVYFFWHQDFASRSLGIFSILFEIQMAKERGIPFYYLGYGIDGHPDMNYKFNFREQQIWDWNSAEWKDR